MRILIIGGNSLLAKEFVKNYNREFDFVTAGRNNCDYFLDLQVPLADYFVPGEFDVVLHMAASFGGGGIENMIEAETTNAIGVLKSSAFAAEKKCKHFVYLSSIYSTLDIKSNYYSIYSLSKRHAEDLLMLFARDNQLNYTILRPAPIYGDSDLHRKHQPAIYSLADKAEKGEDIIINGSRNPLRNYIHSSDVCEIICKTILNNVFGLYSCVNVENTSLFDMANSLIKAFRSSSKIIYDPSKSDISDNVFEANSELYKLINFYPRISMNSGMERIAKNRCR